MNKLERLDELRIRAEEALRRSISGNHAELGPHSSQMKEGLSVTQIELLLENESLKLRKKRLEAELNTYKMLFSDAPVAYLTIEKGGKVILFNKEACRFLNPADKNTEELSIHLIAANHSRDDLGELADKVLRTGIQQSAYLHLTDGQEKQEPYHVTIAPCRDENSGKKLCKIMISRVPDQENFFQNELKKKEKEYEELMSNISDGIFYTVRGVLSSINPSFSHILGYAEKELKGKAVWELVADSHQQFVKDLFNDTQPTDMKPSYEVKCIRKDRTVFWAELKIKHLSKGNKSFGSLSDITARKLSENQMKDSERLLMRSNAAKDKLFSIISHDLKTPFNTLMGYTYLLMKEYGHYDDEKRETMIRSLYDVTKQTFNMLENILVWSRSQTGGIPFVPRGISISKLLIENIRLYTPTAKAKCISLTLGQELQEVIVFADPDMVQTVIRNLVTNAIKFTPEKGRVSLGLIDDDEEKITVYVKDNGVGIEPDKIDHLFHIDNNYSTRGTNDEKGTGLGLTVCREFVEKNGGEIWIDSTPGKGSCFYFSLYKKVDEVI